MTRELKTRTLPLRGLRSFAGGAIVLALIVLAVAGSVVAWPRVTASILNADLQYRLAAASAQTRDLQSSIDADPIVSFDPTNQSSSNDPSPFWSAMPKTLLKARAAMPASLRELTSPGRFVARDNGKTGSGLIATGTTSQPPHSHYQLNLESNSELESDAVLISGNWPAKTTRLDPSQPVQLVMTKQAATLWHWSVGQTQSVTDSSGQEQPVILVGLVRPRNVHADYWQLDLNRAEGGAVLSVDGDSTTYKGVAWMDAASWPAVGPYLDGQTLVSWFELRGHHLTADRLSSTVADLQRFLAVARPVGAADSGQALRFTTNLPLVADDFTGRAIPASSLLAVVGAGPLGAGLVVLLLAVILVVERRRSTLRLVRSRGGSRARVMATAAIEVAVPTVPAAIVGGLAGALLSPGGLDWSIAPSIAVCAVVPAGFAAAVAGMLALDRGNGYLLGRWRWRWAVEVLVGVLAVLSVTLTIQRGGTTSDTVSAGADPLLTVTPLLVSAAICVGLLRLYPLLLIWVGSVLRRRVAPVGYVGWATSARSAARFLPVFAVVTGVSVTLFSLSLLATERSGIRDAAVSLSGADITVSALPLSNATVKQIAALPGIAHSATVSSAGGASISGVSDGIALFTVDAKALAAVQSELPATLRQFSALGAKTNHGTTVIARGLPSGSPHSATLQLPADTKVLLAPLVGASPTFVSDPPWIMVDRTALPTQGAPAELPLTMLIQVRSGANDAKLAAAAQRIAGPSAIVTDAQKTIAHSDGAPIVGGFQLLTYGAIALSALLAIAAILLTLVSGTAGRSILLARLRALGFSRRQSSGLVAWEVGPLIALGAVVGAAVAVVTIAVMFGSVNLAGFTGGVSRPATVVDPVAVAIVLAVFVAIGILASLAAIGLSGRAAVSGSRTLERED